MNATETITEITHKHLAAVVAEVVRFCPGARCPRPVLRTVLVRCDDDGTTATATDLEHRIICRMAGGSGRGVAMVPTDMAKALGKAGGETVRFSEGTVSAAGITAAMEDPMEYPSHPLFGLPATATISFRHAEMIAKAPPAAVDGDSARYALGGIRLEIEGGRLVAVGTDGRRLHCLEVPTIGDADGPIDAVAYPVVFTGLVRAVRGIAREVLGLRGKKLEDALERSTVEIRRAASDHMIEVRWAAGDCIVAVQGREIEGRFPRWRDVFTDGCYDAAGSISLRVGDGIEQMRAAGRCATEVFKGANFKAGEVSSGHDATGAYRAPIAGSMSGFTAIKLDPVYVREALEAVRSIGGGEARFVVTDDQSAAHLRSCERDDVREAVLRVVIMPLAAD